MKRDVLLLAVTGIWMLIFLFFALIISPPEQHMGDLVRILYFHVNSAWTALLAFFTTFLASIGYLVRRKPMWDVLAASAAEIGVMFTTFTLITGSLWGRPVWNTWWTWDPRLTTTLILWFLYVAYLLLRQTIDGLERRGRVAAVYAIVAFADVPIIHESVTWWRSIHPTVIDDSGFHMPASMTIPLLMGAMAFFLLFGLLLWLRCRLEWTRLEVLRIREQVRHKEFRPKTLHKGVQV
ncbi:MAG: cytochrome c biogenesis protein CcsA [Alicyclobacillus herbarius]|uniref:cytochrome c biogenesis protein CcsA n=1 Tax=Alicyclobacillus herbarius TaxID=122960 RepID=UPI0003FC8A12|nr:cytochrome c biogenesis protein CcsA [Alicyclobacillus herbarius]MCL6631228.1 cytochrome c biogenesis protein CcsA [Alicyclobacillus herbarius]